MPLIEEKATGATRREKKTASLVSPKSQPSRNSSRLSTTNDDNEQFERGHTNVCKITVLPKIQSTRSAALTVHRLEVEAGSRTTMSTENIRPHGTCITINHRSSGGSGSSDERHTDDINRVTISVGGNGRHQLQGQDTIYNPTVISVNGETTQGTLPPLENQQQQEHVFGDQKGTLILVLDQNKSGTALNSSSSVDWPKEVIIHHPLQFFSATKETRNYSICHYRSVRRLIMKRIKRL